MEDGMERTNRLRWEYTDAEVPDATHVRLERAGQDGWEAFAVTNETTGYRVWLKRQARAVPTEDE